MKDKVIIFDFFGVICADISKIWFDKYFPDWLMPARYECCVTTDLGDISEESFFRTLGLLAQQDPGQIRADWILNAKIDAQVISEIIRLKNTHNIILASNAPTPLISEILEKNKLSKLFDELIISAEINMVKPDKNFFEYILSRIDTNIKNIVFIDDNPDNVASAKELGIRAIQFKSVDDLRNIN